MAAFNCPAGARNVWADMPAPACGYSDKDQVFVVRNSWGNSWGHNGYCYVPYEYLAHPDFTDDCWTLRRAHNVDFSANLDVDRSGNRSFFNAFVEMAVNSVANSIIEGGSQSALGGIVGGLIKTALSGNQSHYNQTNEVQYQQVANEAQYEQIVEPQYEQVVEPQYEQVNEGGGGLSSQLLNAVGELLESDRRGSRSAAGR